MTKNSPGNQSLVIIPNEQHAGLSCPRPFLTFAADGAAVGTLSGVQPLVGLEAVRVPQRLAAVAAQEAAAAARVGEHVAAQLGLLGEGVVALAAAEGSLPAVDPQVTLQVSCRAVRRAGEPPPRQNHTL